LNRYEPNAARPGHTRHRREAPVKLDLKGITKRSGSLVANDHIDTVSPGQIHALPGENERARRS
jgi:ABC-type sugar transport system ATPase subunit